MFQDQCQVNFEEILKKLDGLQEHDGYWTSFCPAHDNHHTQSLSISIRDGKLLFHCFSAGCTAQQISEALGISMRDLFVASSAPATQKQSLTISALAYHKKLPPEFMALYIREVSGSKMKELFNVGRGKDTWSNLQFVYKDMAGCESTCQQRFRSALRATDGSYWDKLHTNKPTMYGLWLVPSFTQDFIIMPEGETNALTLWYHNLPAISFPGATMSAKLQRDHISKFKRIYLCNDKDVGGETLAIGLQKQLKKLRYPGEVFVITFPEGCKDVSDLHCKCPESFDAAFQKSMEEAVPLDTFVASIHAKTAAKIDPAKPSANDPYTKILRTIKSDDGSLEYRVTDKGIFLITSEYNQETGTPKITQKRICADPVYISERLVDIFNSTSQVRLIWGKKESVIPATCLSGTDMKVLTEIGLRILTPNGQDMAKYFLLSLEKLEDESTFASRNGWLNRKHQQFILGQKMLKADRQDTIARYNDDTLDLAQTGTRAAWLKLVKQYYSNKFIALALSASAASFLFAPYGIESSILHLYGDSSCGKSTATLFAASLWGQPMMTQDRAIRRNWNSTPVGIELYLQQMFNLCCFLEDSADVKDDETLARLVQAFVNGSGKNRGTIAKKNGGLSADRTKNWQTLLLSTGEKRITDTSNMGGVAARTMEVEVTRVTTYRQSDFQTIRTTLANNFGFGNELINYWFGHKEDVQKHFDDYLALLEETYTTVLDPNIPQTQQPTLISETKSRCLCALALILTGNYLLSQVFELDAQTDIIVIIEKILSDDDPKGSKGVYESLVEHYTANPHRFSVIQKGADGNYNYLAPNEEAYGFYHPAIHAVCFFLDKLRLHLKKIGFTNSQVAMLKKEGKLIVTPSEGNRYAIKINGVRVRVYAIKMPE